MTLKKRMIMILAVAVIVGGFYGVGQLGWSVQTEKTEAEEEAEDSLLDIGKRCIYGMRMRRLRII